MENKQSFFLLDLRINKNNRTDHYLDQLNNSVDLILSSMAVGEFRQKNRGRIIYVFKPDKRKRKGQLIKFCHRFLPNDDNLFVDIKGITKDVKDYEITRLKHQDNFINDTGASMAYFE